MILFGIPVVGLLLNVLFLEQVFDLNDPVFLINWVISCVYTTIYWSGNRFIIIRMRKRFPGIEMFRKRILWQFVLVNVFTFTFCNVIDQAFKTMVDSREFQPESLAVNVASFTATYIILLIYESAYLYQRWRDSLIMAEKLRKENILSQLQSLKDQVNPHFLFNSLNTLASLIPEDPERAVTFVTHLSKCYRYILEIQDREVITLREELAFLNAFRYLLETRFGENIDFKVEIPESEMEKDVVPLALQLLIENAIKHNIVSTEKPLHISLYVEKDNLVVRNNLQRKSQPMPSTKTGLNNLKKRYQYLADKTVDIIVTHTDFIVSLPLLQYR